MKVRTIQVPERIIDWAKGIGKSTAAQMANRYAKDGVLVPTFDNILKGRKRIEGYFKEFLDKKNMKCKITDSQTILIGNGYSVTNGYYVFTFDDPEEPGETDVVFARYTFVLNPKGEIITQHSSEEPDDEE
jgi:hypothetical protein